ncbi:hypothetical protein HMPREF9733_00060 [Treponema denticola SP33]|uniref:Uncharacterized protein n=1 Tax=Treponema denticola SP33 TaxID=999437 RepID=M2BUU5_TREDN|nr:hypothetical protein HMPREF9733_00060 [Treponema denticola SP33]EPF36228.1 hypothetical protein HMPREF9732_01848 [Treponema denticola SP32]
MHICVHFSTRVFAHPSGFAKTSHIYIFTGLRAGIIKPLFLRKSGSGRGMDTPQTGQKCTSVYIFDRRVCLAANIAYVQLLPASVPVLIKDLFRVINSQWVRMGFRPAKESAQVRVRAPERGFGQRSFEAAFLRGGFPAAPIEQVFSPKNVFY